MTYTKIAKPSATSYTNINIIGKQQYDQSDISYDDSTTYYDGVNLSQYTKISKPAGEIVAVAGLYYGFGAFTYSGGQIFSTRYTKVNKPS